MKIYEEAMDQCLLCIDYRFREDAPIAREVAEAKFQPGVRQKKWWNYRNRCLGLKTLTAYIGPRPVGQIEFTPIEYAPRPIDGNDYHVITCLHVAHDVWNQGIGSSLLAEAEIVIRSISAGVALIASTSSEFMPADFFSRHSYTTVDRREGEQLMHKRFRLVPAPSFFPIKPIPKSKRGLRLDYYHCAQCPRSGWALEQLRQNSFQNQLPEFKLVVTNIDSRNTVRAHGIAHRVFLNGQAVGGYPYPPDLQKYMDALLTTEEAAT